MNLGHILGKSLERIFKTSINLIVLFSIFSIGLVSCDLLTNEKDEDPDTLYVKFTNSTESAYTITNIQLQAMGKAGETAQPSGIWSDNILPAGTTLAPGEHTFFDLDIPNLHWSQYRLGVDDGQGNEIMMHEQQSYQQSELPITHWGSDDRSVSVTLVYNQYAQLIEWSGWSDFAGID